MSAFIPRYALDPTGMSPDNFVVNEPHVLMDFRVRAVVPKEGAFFGDSVVVIDQATGKPLTPGKQFVPQEYLRTPSDLYGKKIYTILLIIDKKVSANVVIHYQALGGHYNRQSTGLKQLLEQKRDDGSDYSFYDVVGRPEQYEPVPHFMGIDDGLKFEYLTTALERIRNAILWSDSIVYQDIYNYIDAMVKDLEARLQIQMDNFVMPILLEFKRQLTKTYIGLGLVENLRVATKEEGAKAAQKDTRYSDFLEAKYVALDTIVAFKNILYDHFVSKEQTNLGKKQAVFQPATKSTLYDMVNGATISFLSKRESMVSVSSFDPNCYPDDIGADTRVAIVKIVNNRNNGGGIYMAYEYGGKYCYLGTWLTGQINDPIKWTRFLFAEDLELYVDELSEHINNTKNPHGTNKDQVGLSEVENLPVITREEILCLKSVRKYLTFDGFLLFMKTYMIGKNGSAADPGDQSNEPLENCQILYCPCSPCGCGSGSGGTTPDPEPECPAAGKLIEQFCQGVDSWGRYANGACGEYTAIIMTNSYDCGYTDPPQPPGPGTELSRFCKGLDQWGKFANGAGGSYEQVIQVNSTSCGYVAPNPKIQLSSNRTELSAGVSEIITINLSGYPANKPVPIEVFMAGPSLNGGAPYKTVQETIQINGSGTGQLILNRQDDGVLIPRGTYDNWVVSTGATPAESNHITRKFIGSTQPTNRVITYSASKTTMQPGDNGVHTWVFSGYPPNTSVVYNVWGNAANFNNGQDYLTLTETVQINSSGTGTVNRPYGYLGNDILPGGGPVRGWVVDPANNVRSNTVTITYVPPACRPAGEKISEACKNGNLVGTFANGSCGEYEQVITYNHPNCGQQPKAIMCMNQDITANTQNTAYPAGTQMSIRKDYYYSTSMLGRGYSGGGGVTMTFGWGNPANVPDYHSYEILNSSGAVLKTIQVDTGRTNASGWSWSTERSLGNLSDIPDGSNYRIRCVIAADVNGRRVTAYSDSYPCSVVTDYSTGPGG